MGLKEVAQELKEKIETAKEMEAEQEKTALAELDKAISEPVQDKKSDEVEKTNEKEIEKPKEEEPVAAEAEKKPEVKTPTDYSKERQARKDKLSLDLATANARIAALEASLKPVQNERAESVTEHEPDKTTNFIAWTEWKTRQQDKVIEHLSGWKAEQEAVRSKQTLREQAVREVEVYENQLRQTNPDYNDVKDYYARMIAASIKIVNPKIGQNQLMETVNNRLLTRAAELLTDGYENPIEAMYLEAKTLGYKPREAAAEQTKEDPKPDLDKVSNLRKRNAGMAGASGAGGEADVTAKVAVGMTNAEFAKLKPEQKKRLFASLRGAA